MVLLQEILWYPWEGSYGTLELSLWYPSRRSYSTLRERPMLLLWYPFRGSYSTPKKSYGITREGPKLLVRRIPWYPLGWFRSGTSYGTPPVGPRVLLESSKWSYGVL